MAMSSRSLKYFFNFLFIQVTVQKKCLICQNCNKKWRKCHEISQNVTAAINEDFLMKELLCKQTVTPTVQLAAAGVIVWKNSALFPYFFNTFHHPTFTGKCFRKNNCYTSYSKYFQDLFFCKEGGMDRFVDRQIDGLMKEKFR